MNDPAASGRISGNDRHFKCVASRGELNPLAGLKILKDIYEEKILIVEDEAIISLDLRIC